MRSRAPCRARRCVARRATMSPSKPSCANLRSPRRGRSTWKEPGLCFTRMRSPALFFAPGARVLQAPTLGERRVRGNPEKETLRGASAPWPAAARRVSAEGLQGRLHDRRRVDLEVRAQRGTRVAATESVGAERDAASPRRQEGADLLGDGTNVVGGDDDRAARRRELLADVA